jgi:hypothetical protein
VWHKQCDLLTAVRMKRVKMGQENVTKQKRIVIINNLGSLRETVLARVLAAVFLSGVRHPEN